MNELTSVFYPDYKIGRWTYGHPEVLEWGEGTTLEIGAFCSIAEGVKIFIGGEHRVDWATTYPFNVFWEQAFHIKGHPHTHGDVIIGNDVWLATDSLILSGVTIGDGAVVGVRSVVTQNIPPYAIVFGNPAKILRYRFDQETITSLLEIAWWNWDDTKIIEFMPYLLSQDIQEFIRRAQSVGSALGQNAQAPVKQAPSFTAPTVGGEQQVRELRARIAESDRKVRDLRAQVVERDGRIQALTAQVVAVYNSRSWKIARPFRMMGSLARAFRRFLGDGMQRLREVFKGN